MVQLSLNHCSIDVSRKCRPVYDVSLLVDSRAGPRELSLLELIARQKARLARYNLRALGPSKTSTASVESGKFPDNFYDCWRNSQIPSKQLEALHNLSPAYS